MAQFWKITTFMFLLCLSSILMSGCKTEFNPNADWREVPVVYCVLDQDDSVSYVRVQKCFLGDGNLTDYASIADSSNYGQGELQVQIKVWGSEADMMREGASPLRILDFGYEMLTDKQAGRFYAPNQPIYSHVNKAGELTPGCVCQLMVTKTATGDVLARGVTQLVGDAESDIWLSSPHPTIPGRAFAFRTANTCQIVWHTFAEGRRYQPSVTFFYRHRYPDTVALRSVVMPLDEVVGNLSDPTLSVSIGQEAYLANIRTALIGDTAAKTFCDTVAISLVVCNEPLHAYLNAVEMMMGSSEQEHQMYTNIEGGLGVFASRRSHLYLLVPSDKSDSPTGLHTLLEQLEVGFERR